MTTPLQDLRVIDLSRIVAGPLATQILADYGAEVIKVERPEVGDDSRQWTPPVAPGGEGTYFFAFNRNKKSLTVNLRHPEGRRIVVELVRRGDILVENFTPGTVEDLGLGYETLRAENPGLIYCSISGFGATGPSKNRAGYDAMMQGLTGLMSITGELDGPPVKVGVAVLDAITALYAHGAILAALHHRQRTGEGQRVNLSLLECGIAALINAATAYLVAGKVQGRMGSGHPSLAPYQAFNARDGALMLGAGNERLWRAFCVAIGAPEWADDPRFDRNSKRVERRQELQALIEDRLQTKDRDTWLQIFAEAGLPCGPINDIAQLFADPQVQHREMIVEVEHPTAGRIKLPGIPAKLSRTPGQIQSAPPLLGQHTEEILTRLLGYSADAITRLRAEGAI